MSLETSGCGHRCCWTFLCPHVVSQDCRRALLRCWVWRRVAAGLLLPLPAPLPAPTPSWGLWPLLVGTLQPPVLWGLAPCIDPPGLCFVPFGSLPGHRGWDQGWGSAQPMGCSACYGAMRCLQPMMMVLPAMVLPAPSLPPAQLSSSPRIQLCGAAATSPALFALGPGSGRSGTDQAHESCPRSLLPTTTEPSQGPRSSTGM